MSRFVKREFFVIKPEVLTKNLRRLLWPKSIFGSWKIFLYFCSVVILMLCFLVACDIESLHHVACVCPALTGLQHSQGFWNMAANLSIKNFTWTFLWVFYLHFLCTKNALKKFLWTPYTSVLTSNAAQMWIWAKWTSCQITADVPHLN